jgi:hypothetical protein
MPSLSKRNSILIIGLVLIILAIGASQGQKQEITDEKDQLAFSEDDLNNLGKSIGDLEFDDLGGLSFDESTDPDENGTYIELTEIDLDWLGELLQGLEFEDLGGLTEE